MMGRKRYAGVYSRRSRFLVVVAAILMVACVPFHYANSSAGVSAMFVIAALALISTLADAVRARRLAVGRAIKDQVARRMRAPIGVVRPVHAFVSVRVVVVFAAYRGLLAG